MRQDAREKLSAILRRACDGAYHFANDLAGLVLDELEAHQATCGRGTQGSPAEQVTQPDRMMTVKEAAEYLRVNERTIRNWVEQGIIPGHRFNQELRFKREEIDRRELPKKQSKSKLRVVK